MTKSKTTYALFHNNKQISKSHSTKQAVLIEAYEHKAILHYSADFPGDTSGIELANGYEIKEIKHD